MVAVLSLGSVDATTAEAAFPGSNGRIAFVSDRDGAGHTDVYSVKPDGSEPLRLTTTALQDETDPVISADGTRIAYLLGGRLWTMSADGSAPPVILNTGSVNPGGAPAWSPDGAKLVFEGIGPTPGGGTTGRKLWIVDAAGGAPSELTASTTGHTTAEKGPAWSPAGNRIAFYSNSTTTGRYEIFTIDAVPAISSHNGGDARVQLTQTGSPDPPDVSSNDENPSWSPDATQIAFERGAGTNVGDSTKELWTIGVGANGTPAAPVTRLTNNSDYDAHPSWSPDGLSLAFESNRAGHLQIFTMPVAAGASATAVMATASSVNDSQPDWGVLPGSAPPVATIDTGPASLNNKGTATFTFHADKPGATFTCELDSGASEPCSSPKAYSGLADGGHTFRLVASEGGHTALVPAVWTWRIDRSTPDTTITSGPGLPPDARFAFTSTKEPQTFECSLDGEAFTACSSPKLVRVDAGNHTFEVRAVDTIGNVDPSPATISWSEQKCERSLKFGIAEVRYDTPDVPGNCFYPGAAKQFTSAPGQPILVNGVRLSPGPLINFRFDTDKKRITNFGPTSEGRAPVLLSLPARIPFPFDAGVFGLDWNVAKANKVATDLNGLWKQLGLPLRFDEIQLVDGGADIPAHIELPKPLAELMGANWKTTASTDLTLHTTNADGVKLTGISAKWPKIPLGALELSDLSLGYNWANKDWNGGATLKFPNGLAIGAEVVVKSGVFTSAKANVTFPDPGVPVFSGVNLTDAGLSVIVQPRFGLDGSAKFAAGGKVAGRTVAAVRGTIGMYFANASNKMDMRIAGAGRTIKLTSPGFYVSGEALMVDKVKLANAYVYYVYPSVLGIGGQVGIKVPSLYSVTGKVEIAADVQKGIFNAEGGASVCEDLIGHQCATGTVVISTKGVAGCVTVGWWGVGGGVDWNWKPEVWWKGCDLGKYRVSVARARAAAAPPTITVRRTAPFTAAQLVSATGAPDITLSGPGGQHIVPTSALYVDRVRGVVVFRDPERNSTYLALDKRLAGSWRVIAAPGSPAITRLFIGDGLPRPTASGRVTGIGRNRTLTYAVDAGDGQRVSFVESGPQTYRLLATTTARRGTLHFRIADGPAGLRSILAVVGNGGPPRATLTLARFTAPPMPTLARPARLAVSRRGDTLMIGWRGVRGARRYAAQVVLGNRRQLLLLTNKRSLRVRRIPATTSAVVRVAALDQLNAYGPAARVLLRAQPTPALSRLSVRPSRFRATKGATVSYRLSRAATLDFTLENRTTGRRLGQGCVPDAPALKKLPTCQAWTPVGATVARTGRSGTNTFRLTARVAGVTLRPGSYRLVAFLGTSVRNRHAGSAAGFVVVK